MPPSAEGFAARFVVGPALRTQPDRRLVGLVREGYENAFEEIVRRYGRALTRYAAAIVGSRAEDVTQDAFSKALLALRRDEREIELRPWLFRVVRNTALNDLRDRPPSAEVLAEAIASGDSPEEELERREELTDLMRRLQSLPEAQRAAIVMRELEGLSHEEIAAALGLSGGAARQAIFRARRALRDGAGMLLPLPLLKALLAGAASAPVEAVTGAAGLGGVAGVGVAAKATVATVLVAGAVGAGVAIDHSRHDHATGPSRAGSVVADDASSAPSSMATALAWPGDSGGGSGSSGHGERGSGVDPGGGHGGPGPSAGADGGGGGRPEPGDDHGGRRSGHDRDGTNDDGNGGHPGLGGGSSSSGSSSGPGGDSSGRGGSSGSSGSSGGSDGSSSGSESDSGSDSSSSGSGPGPSSNSGSEANPDSGPGSGSGSEGSGGDDSSGSGSSGDSHSGSGFSLQIGRASCRERV